MEGKKVSHLPPFNLFIRNWFFVFSKIGPISTGRFSVARYECTICQHMVIFHPSLSLQASDGPPGKLGFPGPQVKLCFSPPSCH